MKYRYLYQTRENETRSGEIKAKNRAEAYAALRKAGIRPYRVIGDDPVRWQPWAAGAAIAALSAALIALAVFQPFSSYTSPTGRGQIPGDQALVSEGVASSWEAWLDTPLDRHLSAYAQPGWIAIPPEAGGESAAAFAADLEKPLVVQRDDPPEVKTLKRMLLAMRAEMKAHLDDGGTAADYLAFLDERQDSERDFRNKAIEAVAKAPPAMAENVRKNVNMRLRNMGLAEIARQGGVK